MPELWQKSDLAQTLEVVKGLEGAPDLKAIAGNTRIRQVWTRERWKLLNRLSKVLEEEGVKMRLVCHLAQCPDKAIKIANDATAPMGAVLRCGCTDRVFARG
jgi:hypothetical protein